MTSPRFEFLEIDCPVCGSAERSFKGWRGGVDHQSGSGERTSIYRCRECTHLYPFPMPIPVHGLNDLYENADEYFKGHDIDQKISNGVEMMRQFEDRLSKKGRFLDVGCGVGELLRAAQDEGWTAEGIDPSEEFVSIGRKKLGVNSKVCTLKDAGYPDKHFDAVAMSSLIEHLYDPLPVLIEIRRILKPAGILWFDAPNEDGLYMKFGNLYMTIRGKKQLVVMAPTFAPYHVQGFNPRSIRTILANADLVPRELSVIGEVCPQTGESSLSKRAEFFIARKVNAIGRKIGMGIYMSVWAQRSDKLK